MAVGTIVGERLFLESTLTELKILEEAAGTHYHGILAGMLAAARRETEMLLREDTQAQAWPQAAEQHQIGRH
jgi:hypothetical protein